MFTICQTCGRGYDDAKQWTICPHGPLGSSPTAYCREHDLVNCPFHDPARAGETVQISASIEPSFAVPAGIHAAMLAETNKLRSSPLGVHASLQAAAQKHAQWMADNRRMSHTGANRSDFIDRIRAENYPTSNAGENVAYGYRDGAACVAAWKGSPGHRRNMLNTSYRSAGFGVAESSNGQLYFCGLYGAAAPDPVPPPLPPSPDPRPEPPVPPPQPRPGWFERILILLGLLSGSPSVPINAYAEARPQRGMSAIDWADLDRDDLDR